MQSLKKRDQGVLGRGDSGMIRGRIKNFAFDVWKIKQEFRRAQRKVLVEIEDTAAASTKIETIAKRAKTAKQVLDSLADRVWLGVSMPGYESARRRQHTGTSSDHSFARVKSKDSSTSHKSTAKLHDRPERLPSRKQFQRPLTRASSSRHAAVLKRVRLGLMGRLWATIKAQFDFSQTMLLGQIPWMNRDELDRRRIIAARQVSYFGLLGIILCVVQNELIFRDWDPNST